MRNAACRHLLAAIVAVGSVAALATVVAANGFQDFSSAFWLLNASQVGALAYALTILAGRALASENDVWKRASTFGGASGAVVVALAFARLADLNTSGVVIALMLTGMLGVALGLAAVEGLRWVRGGAAPGEAV